MPSKLLCHGASSPMIVCHQRGILKDTMAGFVYIQTICYNAVGCDLWGMDLVLHVLGKLLKKLVVFDTVERIRLS